MKKIGVILIFLVSLCLFCSCQSTTPSKANQDVVTEILLSDQSITADGKEVSGDTDHGLYVANDIIYYEAGKDFTYGEGSEKDAHEKQEADSHTVLHITKAGAYRLKGKLSRGQIAVDLGDDAEEDPTAVVTLILDGVDITCTVAPAVIFYNVYECSDKNEENATKDVDTSGAGANVILTDGSVNAINGSYVERIHKPDSVVLNEDKTEVEDAKKLHKYDGAFYSKMSMNVGGEKKGNGILNITAENEGLNSELHLTVNGGEINILSGNDGINTNEDKVSVTTVNGGKVNIKVTGETGEGDGIDSNGWLVINGGAVICQACEKSADAGIDSDNGIYINGGTVVASGSMLDRIEDGGQTYTVFNFAQKQKGNEKIKLKNQKGNIVFEVKPENAYSVLIVSIPDLPEGTYTLWSGDTQLKGQSGSMPGGGGMRPEGEAPEGQTPPEKPEDEKEPQEKIPSDKIERPSGERPNPSFDFPDNGKIPDFNFPEEGFPNFEFPEGQMPQDNFPDKGSEKRPEGNQVMGEFSTEFIIKEGANSFSEIKPLTE